MLSLFLAFLGFLTGMNAKVDYDQGAYACNEALGLCAPQHGLNVLSLPSTL
jgi:hypothetical protein